MVRRLKADLRRLGEAFPERKVEPIPIAGLPTDAPELDLWRRLAAYGELRRRRIAKLPPHKAALAKLAFVGLQQRLLSSIAAFARTLKVHRKTLERLLDGEAAPSVSRPPRRPSSTAARPRRSTSSALEDERRRGGNRRRRGRGRRGRFGRRRRRGAQPPTCAAELAAVDDMLAIAENAAAASRTPGCTGWSQWIKANLLVRHRAGTIAG